MGIKYDWATGNYTYSGLTLSGEELHSFRRSNAERMYNLIIEGRANVQEILDEDKYYYIVPDDNYVLRHKGDTVTLIDGGGEVAKEITREEFNEGVKRLAQENMKSKRGDCTNG